MKKNWKEVRKGTTIAEGGSKMPCVQYLQIIIQSTSYVVSLNALRYILYGYGTKSSVPYKNIL